jgi:hypothetical protein
MLASALVNDHHAASGVTVSVQESSNVIVLWRTTSNVVQPDAVDAPPVWRLPRVQVRKDGEHASVVVGGLRQAQRAEDVLDVLLDRVLGDE